MPKVMHLSSFPGPALICSGGPERRCMWHSLAGQPMAFGSPLWASVFLVFVPVLNSQACVFRSQGLGQGQGRQCGEERGTEDASGMTMVPGTGITHLGARTSGHCSRASSGCRSGGAGVRDPWQQRWELLHKYPVSSPLRWAMLGLFCSFSQRPRGLST